MIKVMIPSLSPPNQLTYYLAWTWHAPRPAPYPPRVLSFNLPVHQYYQCCARLGGTKRITAAAPVITSHPPTFSSISPLANSLNSLCLFDLFFFLASLDARRTTDLKAEDGLNTRASRVSTGFPCITVMPTATSSFSPWSMWMWRGCDLYYGTNQRPAPVFKSTVVTSTAVPPMGRGYIYPSCIIP